MNQYFKPVFASILHGSVVLSSSMFHVQATSSYEKVQLKLTSIEISLGHDVTIKRT